MSSTNADHCSSRDTQRIYFARAVDGIDRELTMSSGQSLAAEFDECGFILVDPLLTEPVRDGPYSAEDWYRLVVQHDLAVLRSCAGVLMDMSIPFRNYIGCSCELVYAHLWKIPTVVFMGENDMDRPWLRYHASAVVRTRSEAVSRLKSLLDDGIRPA